MKSNMERKKKASVLGIVSALFLTFGISVPEPFLVFLGVLIGLWFFSELLKNDNDGGDYGAYV